MPHRVLVVLLGFFVGGCYLSHELNDECPTPAPGERALAEPTSGERMIPVASDGCGRIVAAWASGEIERRRLVVARVDDAGTPPEVLLDEELPFLVFWDLALDERGEPILVTVENEQVLVRRVADGRLGAPMVLNMAGERAGWMGTGGSFDNSRLVRPIAGGGALITFWEWRPATGEVVIARVGAEGPPRIRRLGRVARGARACLAPSGAVAVAWQELGDGSFFAAVVPDFEGPFEQVEIDGAWPDVACEPDVVLTFQAEDAVHLSRWDGSGWQEVARWPTDPEFTYPEVHPGPTHAVVSWPVGYDSPTTRLATWSPADGAGDPTALAPGLVVCSRCAGPAGTTVVTTGRDRGLSVLSFDRSGTLHDVEIADADGRFRAGVACLAGGSNFVTFRRDARPWLAVLSR